MRIFLSLPLVGRVDASDLGDAKRRPESVGVGVQEKWPPTLAYALLRPSLPAALRGEGSNADLFVR
jgi:hypothetical protein